MEQFKKYVIDEEGALALLVDPEEHVTQKDREDWLSAFDHYDFSKVSCGTKARLDVIATVFRQFKRAV